MNNLLLIPSRIMPSISRKSKHHFPSSHYSLLRFPNFPLKFPLTLLRSPACLYSQKITEKVGTQMSLPIILKLKNITNQHTKSNKASFSRKDQALNTNEFLPTKIFIDQKQNILKSQRTLSYIPYTQATK